MTLFLLRWIGATLLLSTGSRHFLYSRLPASTFDSRLSWSASTVVPAKYLEVQSVSRFNFPLTTSSTRSPRSTGRPYVAGASEHEQRIPGMVEWPGFAAELSQLATSCRRRSRGVPHHAEEPDAATVDRDITRRCASGTRIQWELVDSCSGSRALAIWGRTACNAWYADGRAVLVKG